MKNNLVLSAIFVLLSFAGKAQALYSTPAPIIYGVAVNGDLIWYRHGNFKTGKPIPPGNTIGFGGWQYYISVFANDNIIYGITPDGNLNWYNYPLSQFGSAEIAGGKTIGFGGWQQFKLVFGGSHGIIYAITADGNLIWYKYDDEQNGNQEVSGGRVIAGGGWDQYRFVFSAGNGIIYAVGTDGNLYWYKHLGWQTGEALWETGGRQEISTGDWDIYKFIFSGGDGIIYAVGTDGNLYWYNHEGYQHGEKNISARSRLRIGTGGWSDFSHVFSGK